MKLATCTTARLPDGLAAHRIGDLPDFRFANEGSAMSDAARSPDSIREVARARGMEEEF
jgi:hypothetical protein